MTRKRWFLPETPDVLGMLRRQMAVTIDGVDAFVRWAGADATLTAATREAVATIASARGCTMVAVALAWLTTRPYVFPIVGARTPSEAVALADPLPVLDADELALLDV